MFSQIFGNNIVQRNLTKIEVLSKLKLQLVFQHSGIIFYHITAKILIFMKMHIDEYKKEKKKLNKRFKLKNLRRKGVILFLKVRVRAPSLFLGKNTPSLFKKQRGERFSTRKAKQRRKSFKENSQYLINTPKIKVCSKRFYSFNILLLE